MLHEYERSQATLQSEREQHATEVAHLRSEAAEARTESRETQRGLEEALSLAESDLLVQRNLASEAQLSQAQVTHERDQAVADARLWKDQLDAVQRENDELRARVDQALEGNDDDKRSMVALQEARSEADTYRKELSRAYESAALTSSWSILTEHFQMPCVNRASAPHYRTGTVDCQFTTGQGTNRSFGPWSRIAQRGETVVGTCAGACASSSGYGLGGSE